jgi:hypothetical protein
LLLVPAGKSRAHFLDDVFLLLDDGLQFDVGVQTFVQLPLESLDVVGKSLRLRRGIILNLVESFLDVRRNIRRRGRKRVLGGVIITSAFLECLRGGVVLGFLAFRVGLGGFALFFPASSTALSLAA